MNNKMNYTQIASNRSSFTRIVHLLNLGLDSQDEYETLAAVFDTTTLAQRVAMIVDAMGTEEQLEADLDRMQGEQA